MKILWAVDMPVTGGGGFGYQIHRNKTKEALLAIGADLTLDSSDDFDVAVHIVRPDYFKPIPGKVNLLFTMVEHSAPVVWGPSVALADVLITPCEHSKEVMSHFYSGPIEICPEGIDPERFPYYRREQPAEGKPFRMLFNGTTDSAGKGACFALYALQSLIFKGDMPAGFQLYIKSSTSLCGLPGFSDSGPAVQYFEASTRSPCGLVGPVAPERLKGIPTLVIDRRKLSCAELRDLYSSSQAFILPSCGDAWALTLTEAMATGLPCTWTHATAMLDYADASIGYPITDLEPIEFWHESHNVDMDPPDYVGTAPTNAGILAAWKDIYHDYPEALRRGRLASDRMHTRYTWRQSAERLLKICEQYT